MKLICQLFRDLVRNSSSLEGLCYDESIQLRFHNTSVIKSFIKNLTQYQKDKHVFNLNITSSKFIRSYLKKNEPQEPDLKPVIRDSDYYSGSYFYIIIVMCFYSIPIIFIIISNLRIFNRSKIDKTRSSISYDEEKQATKVTIDMIFQNKIQIKRLRKKVSNKQKRVKMLKFW
jgi:hypothetical protein